MRLNRVAAILFLVTLLVVPGLAEENGSYVIVDDGVNYGAPNPNYRITQGQNVYVNDTIDIAGMGWGTGLAWYGKYQEFSKPQYIYDFTNFRRSLQNFYLDPAIFEGKSGVWYQYYGNETERNGNLDAFKVVNAMRNQTATYPNGTVIQSAVSVSNVTSDFRIKPKPLLPEIQVSDYLVALGDPLPTNHTSLWIFGRTDMIYAHAGNISAKEIQQLAVGSYKLISHDAGRNTIYEVGYDSSKNMLTSPWKGVDDESILGSQPMLDIDKFYWMVKKTDDKVETFNLDVEEPAISVVSIDEVDVRNRIPVAFEPGMTLLDVRGYTNTANETKLTFILDPDTHNARELKSVTYYTTAIRSSPGNRSMYQIYIPINKNQMPNGMHTIKAMTALGGSMLYDFPVSELPADSFVPNATIKYIGDRNPWVAPVTVVVTQDVIREVIKEVIVEVTPDPQVLYEQELKAKKAVADDFYGKVVVGVTLTVIVISVTAGIFYTGTIVYRARRKQE